MHVQCFLLVRDISKVVICTLQSLATFQVYGRGEVDQIFVHLSERWPHDGWMRLDLSSLNPNSIVLSRKS